MDTRKVIDLQLNSLVKECHMHLQNKDRVISEKDKTIRNLINKTKKLAELNDKLVQQLKIYQKKPHTKNLQTIEQQPRRRCVGNSG